MNVFDKIKGGLIVSCQALETGASLQFKNYGEDGICSKRRRCRWNSRKYTGRHYCN